MKRHIILVLLGVASCTDGPDDQSQDLQLTYATVTTGAQVHLRVRCSEFQTTLAAGVIAELPPLAITFPDALFVTTTRRSCGLMAYEDIDRDGQCGVADRGWSKISSAKELETFSLDVPPDPDIAAFCVQFDQPF